jgi:DNA-binding HxlR family transcriptional regulator
MSAADPGGLGATPCHENGARQPLRPVDSSTASDDGGDVEDPIAPLEGRWVLRILVCLNTGEQRFADLRSAIPRVSANILTDRLRALECVGIVERRYLAPPQASHVYALTEIGIGLRPVLGALASWRVTQPNISIPSRRTGES